MSLMQSPFYFADYVDNFASSPSLTVVGTNVTSGAANTDGSNIALLSALAFDVHYLVISIGGVGVNGSDTAALLDILVDPAGGTSYSVLIADLACGFTVPVTAGRAMQLFYHFPIWIPAGTSVAARVRCTTTTKVFPVAIQAYGNPSNPDMWWCGQAVETLGYSATSKLATVSSGNGAVGAWTNIGTSTQRYGAIQVGNGGINTGSGNATGVTWEIGVASGALKMPPHFSSMTTTELLGLTGINQPIWCDMPSGTVYQMRGAGSSTGTQFNLGLYGVY